MEEPGRDGLARGASQVSARKQPRSIRRVVLTLFAVSLGISFLLLVGFEDVVSSYYRGESTPFTRLFHPAPPVVRIARIMVRTLRAFNGALLKGHDAVLNDGFLARLAENAHPLGIVVRVGGKLEFASPPLSDSAMAGLPVFDAPAPAEPFEDNDRGPHVMYQFDFRSSSGAPASFFILHEPLPGGERTPFSRQLLLIGALLLLAADGAAGVLFILRLTTPLRRVEAAALAMSHGDLDTPVESRHQILELARVFEAMETMRSEIRDLLNRASEREAERRELIANLSHDLRTPLAAIRGYVDGLREGIADTPEKTARYLGVIGAKILDLDRMIDQIFLLSTLEAREAPPTMRVFDLRAFLRDSVEDLLLAIPGDELVIEASGLEGAPRPVRADPLQLRRVVENIVDNARRHGGKRPVTLSLALEEADERLRILLEDDGRGIPSEESERVFERFFRGDASRPGGGFGLGLAIARRLVEAQGGSISLESRRGSGARFVITLPATERKA
ncbi:MAG TPA: HAMP domain-containing sensor histidine kinase [Rectinemataceae bacterium]|nr:HAMP domain-containing sensor histidine kinase [Rectinemataceae bacterium]